MGTVDGYSDGNFKLENNITRAEVAKIIMNFYFSSAILLLDLMNV